MRFDELLNELASGIAGSRIHALLAGGWALSAYGVSRQTVDVDFVILDADLPHVDALMQRLGYRQAFQNPLFARYRDPGGGGPDVDFLFVARDTVDKLLADSGVTTIGRASFRVPSLRHLLGMKLHALKCGRATRGVKDLADIEALLRANLIDLDSADFRELCLRYGTEEIYEEIRSHRRG